MSKHLIRVAALAAVCLGGTAFAGLSWAEAGSGAHTAKAGPGKVCARFDGDDSVRCLGPAPRGKRGKRGATGFAGAQGPSGIAGISGVVGAVGLQGRQGDRGAQGATGPTGAVGPNGAFVGGGQTQTVLGPVSNPYTLSQNGRGTELPPAVATCPNSGPDQEAYQGGARITTTDSNGDPSNDVVELESSYPGTLNGQNEVDPIPVGASEAANAYEAQAVVSYVANNLDRATIQAYVVCGP